ncbi:hypothetical protein [Sphingomonas oryzagri]
MAIQNGLILSVVLIALATAVAIPLFWKQVDRSGITISTGKKRAAAWLLGIAATVVCIAQFGNSPEGMAIAAKQKAEKAQAKAAEQQAALAGGQKDAADAAENRRTGQHCLGWNDSYPQLVNWVKSNTRNPKSFEHIQTVMMPIDKNGVNEVMMRYRAQNGFGGMNIETIGATVDPDTCDMKKVIPF